MCQIRSWVSWCGDCWTRQTPRMHADHVQLLWYSRPAIPLSIINGELSCGGGPLISEHVINCVIIESSLQECKWRRSKTARDGWDIFIDAYVVSTYRFANTHTHTHTVTQCSCGFIGMQDQYDANGPGSHNGALRQRLKMTSVVVVGSAAYTWSQRVERICSDICRYRVIVSTTATTVIITCTIACRWCSPAESFTVICIL